MTKLLLRYFALWTVWLCVRPWNNSIAKCFPPDQNKRRLFS